MSFREGNFIGEDIEALIDLHGVGVDNLDGAWEVGGQVDRQL